MLRHIAVAALLAAVAPVASARDIEPSSVTDTTIAGGVIGAEPSNWSIGIAFGYGVRTNPLIQSDDIPILVDLDIAWFGERFFFDNGDVGLTFSDNDLFTLNLIGRFNSDRVFFGKTNTRIVQVGLGTGNVVDVEVRVPDRDYAIEAGVELLTNGDWGRLQLTAFHDVSATHGGYELGADYSFGIRQQRWYIEPSVGIGVKSRKLNDYYWGIRDDEASLALAGYRADSGINVSLRVLGSYQLTTNWAVAIVAEYEQLNDEAAQSPIVRDDHVAGFFAGFGYRF
ncbi:MAG TPA: MipA/OmpV family protein [Woeseiaceae bacterium]